MEDKISQAFEAAGRAAAVDDAAEDRTVCTTCNPLQPSRHLLRRVLAVQREQGVRSLSSEVVPLNNTAKSAWRTKLAELSKGKECDHCGARINLHLRAMARQ